MPNYVIVHAPTLPGMNEGGAATVYRVAAATPGAAVTALANYVKPTGDVQVYIADETSFVRYTVAPPASPVWNVTPG